jgi:uncharacterized protein (TIGR03083 family)
MGDEPIVDVLEHIWSSTLLATEGLDEGDWARPSELPGWTLKDCLSHVATIEAGLLGEAPDPVPVDHIPHVVTSFQKMMEVGVEAWRPLSGAEVWARAADVLPRRAAQLRAMTDEEMAAPSWSPIGEVPYRDFLMVRAFDCWMHEQDIRRVLDRPGDLDGPAVEPALARFRAALPAVVGKRAGAPDGARIVMRTTGPTEIELGLLVEGRARLVEPAEVASWDEPTVVVTLPFAALAALGGGRWDRERAEATGSVAYEGDVELGRRVLESLAFTP